MIAGRPTDLDAFLTPHAPDPHAVDRLGAADCEPGAMPAPSNERLGVRLARSIVRLWSATVVYDDCGETIQEQLRKAGRKVLKEVKGDVDRFESLCGAAMLDTEWLKWTRKCPQPFGVGVRMCAWIALHEAPQPDPETARARIAAGWGTWDVAPEVKELKGWGR